MDQLERMFNFSLTVFKARDEVFRKLSKEIADVKMKMFFFEQKFEIILKSRYLNVKSKILVLLCKNDELNLETIKKFTGANKTKLEKIMKILVKERLIEYNRKKDTYYLKL